MRSASVILAVLVGCGSTASNVPRTRMTAKDIVEVSSPAIVRIEAGDNKVGTGFIVDKTGLIATNLHVVAGETDIKVRLYKDPTEYPAMYVAGYDKGHDLALVRIKPKKDLPTV